MGVNITGKGVLSGLASLVVGISNVVNALKTLLYTYTTTGTPGTQGGSYYTTYEGSASDGYVMIAYDGKIYYTANLESDWTFTADIGNWGWYPPQYIEAGSMYYAGQEIRSKSIFFAGSQYGRTAYSTDGLTWTMGDVVFPNEGFSSTVFKFAYGIFIAVNTQQGKTAYSYDGQNWTYNAQSLEDIAGPISGVGNLTTSFMQNIQTLNGRFIVASSYGAIASSADGINWTAFDSGHGFNSHTNIIKIGYTVYIPLRDGGLMTTSNGSDWSYNPTFPPNIYELVWLNGVWLGIPNAGMWGSSYTTVYRGINTDNMVPILTAPAIDIVIGDPDIRNGIVYGDSRAVILDENGQIYVSLNEDYTSWSNLFQAPGSFIYSGERQPLNYQDSVYTFSVTNFNTNTTDVYTSADGLTWSYQTLPSFTLWPLRPEKGVISTLREVQTVIGGQGESGSFVESLVPVSIFDLLQLGNPGDSVNFRLTVTNSGTSNEYVSAAFSFDGGITISNDAIWNAEDVLVAPGQTVELYNFTGLYLLPWQENFEIYGIGTAANVLTFKVYNS